MDSRLLDYYDRELVYLKDMGKEFATRYPGVADRLRIEETDVRDPYVRHLMQAFAFLTARVSMRFDDEFPTICQSLLEAIYPSALAPVPWTAVVEMEPEESAVDGSYTIERGTRLRVPSLVGRSDCLFTTAHDVVLRPLKITDVRYIGRDVNTLGADLPDGARAALVISVAAEGSNTISDLEIDYLRFFVFGSDETSARLYQQIMSNAMALVVRRDGRRPSEKLGRRIPESLVRTVGFDPRHAALPVNSRAFDGHRLLSEYFMLPQRYHFFDLGIEPGDDPTDMRTKERYRQLREVWRSAMAECTSSKAEFIIPLSDRIEALEGQVNHERLRLHATPVINLFDRSANRIDLEKHRQEYAIDVDRMRALDYEVHTVTEVNGIGGRDEIRRRYRPFFASHDSDVAKDTGSFYALRRRRRLVPSQGQRSTFDYAATDTCISLVDREHAPVDPDVKQLEVRAMCTNAHLAAEVASRPDAVRFRLTEHAPVASINRLASSERPRPSNIEGEAAWRFIGRLRLNYLSLTDDEQGAEVLRSTLRLFADPAQTNQDRQIEGLLALKSEPIVRPVVESGRLAWVRGIGVRVTLDEENFRGDGHFALGAVLDRFFAQYVSINSLTETTLCTKQNGATQTWPARSGRRWTL